MIFCISLDKEPCYICVALVMAQAMVFVHITSRSLFVFSSLFYMHLILYVFRCNFLLQGIVSVFGGEKAKLLFYKQYFTV